MEQSERNLVLAALDTTSTSPPETVNDLVKYLVKAGIFTDAVVNQHLREILGIWNDWRQRSALSPPDSNIGGRQDEADSNSPTGKLALYGPVDNQVKENAISLFRPLRCNFCLAYSRRSDGVVSFIQEETLRDNDLEPEDDGTITIQWRYPARAPDGFEDRDDQRARRTLCVVLSADDAKEVGMTVDVVFGTSCVAALDQQRSHIPPPPCPSPPRAPPSEIDQLDGTDPSSYGEAEGAAQQMVPIIPPGSYQRPRLSQAEPTPFVNNANQVFILNNFPDPLALIQQIGSSVGNQGVAPSARTTKSTMSDAHAVGVAGKRKADGDSQGFGRAKRFHG